MKVSGTVLPGQIPICQNENQNLKPSSKLTWAWRVAYILCNDIFLLGIEGVNCPVRSMNIFPLVLRLYYDFPFGRRDFLQSHVKTGKFFFLIKKTVCYLDLSESREHKPKSVRISPLWVTKHILFTKNWQNFTWEGFLSSLFVAVFYYLGKDSVLG